ncbi:MAG TPA: hypothetical protein VGK35_05600 [Actinotalea sp.]
MSWSEVTLMFAVALLVLLWWVWVAASRLDRLHRKASTSRAALDNQLVRRASAAAELASSGLLDPVSSVLVGEAAWAALSAGGYGRSELVAALPDLPELADGVATDARPSGTPSDGAQEPLGPADRDMAESELSRTIRAALEDPGEVELLRSVPLGAELVDALAAAWYRVQLSRRFHNEAATQTQRMRRKLLVRLLRLPGHATMPHTVEIDDAWPEAFPRPGA